MQLQCPLNITRSTCSGIEKRRGMGIIFKGRGFVTAGDEKTHSNLMREKEKSNQNFNMLEEFSLSSAIVGICDTTERGIVQAARNSTLKWSATNRRGQQTLKGCKEIWFTICHVFASWQVFQSTFKT